MDFNLKNYNDFNIKRYVPKIFSDNEKKLPIIANSNNFNFLQIINLLKFNKTLSPYENYKVNVNFENFTDFRELIFNTKKTIYNFFNKIKLTTSNYPESSWSDDFKNSIHITNNLYSTKTSFTEFLNKNLTANEVLIYTFLHELGHSIHSELKKKTGLNFSSKNVFSSNIQQFLNDSIPFKDLNSLNTNSHNSKVQAELEKDLSLVSHYGMKEGFADLYACIAVSLIYPKQQAENIIQTVFDGRNYSDKWNKEFYHSKDSVQKFLNDFKNNNVKFNSFIDIHNYIEKTISNTVINKLTEQVNNISNNDMFVNHYFGVLKNKLKPQNCNSLNDMIDYVNNTYGFNLMHRTQNEFFENGYKSANKSSPNSQISKFEPEVKKVSFNISSLRKQFISPTVENNITKSNIKI